MIIYPDARSALNFAANSAPAVIAYFEGKGWVVYPPTSPIPYAIPELLFVSRTVIVPLSDTGYEVFMSALASYLGAAGGNS